MKEAPTASDLPTGPVEPIPGWSYAAEAGFFDEALDTQGEVRPHWRELSAFVESAGSSGMARRWQEGRRLIRENGVTYNVYSGSESAARPWPVDPLPLMFGADEWRSIETAIVQRATLLNEILKDLYGAQRLIRERWLPPDLVLPNPSFLRPCWGVEPPGGTWLHVYAADIARSPDGQWWVLSDRTQAPSGAGYALENRLVTTRVLQDVFRGAHVRRVARFFQDYRETLQGLVRANRENPRIVLLTPGPYNETYFEHAFLARYLGYTLVQGGDLTVREDRVYLKTLGGLLPVDVILRRQDDHFCDPVELRGDSMLGVPGLLQAVRSGNVAVSNALGSGAAESPAYAPFLPGLCRHLLDEDLRMPNVATWWCGERKPLEYVAEHLDDLVIKPTYPGRRLDAMFGAELSAAQRAELLSKIRREPSQYVAQEQVALSTAPVWSDGELLPRHMVLRVFAVASGGTYSVMPGGLTRVSKSMNSMVVSMASGGGSKDTWVLGDGPPSTFSLLRQASHPLEVSRATFDLPSRVADNLFWFGRYSERLEAAVRIARVLLPRFIQDADPEASAGLDAGLEVLSGLGYIGSVEDRASSEREILEMIYSQTAPNGLVNSIRQIRRVAGLLRDRISADAWLIPNQLEQEFTPPPPARTSRTGAAQDLLNRAVVMLQAFSGMATENMTRGDGWRFLDIGKRLERALQMVELLRYALPASMRGSMGALEAVLEMADGSITYRSRYLTSLHADLVLDLLLMDEANPRSVAFQLARLREQIDLLPNTVTATRRPKEARVVLAALTAVQLADVRELAKAGATETTEGEAGETKSAAANAPTDKLDALLTRLAGDLSLLSETLSRAYFSHATQSRQLATS